MKQDYALSVYWYQKAAGHEDADAQFRIGAMYNEGKGVPKNYIEAMKWFRKAAEQGNSKGQSFLGIMYDQGKGVNKDLVQALAWYTVASASKMDASAVELRDELEKGLTPHQITQAQQLAVKYQRKIDLRKTSSKSRSEKRVNP